MNPPPTPIIADAMPTELPVRFDVISINAGTGEMLIEHIEGAF